MTVPTLAAVGLAVTAAALFALAATLQNGAVARIVGGPVESAGRGRPAVGVAGLARLVRSPAWLTGTATAGTAAVLHAGALVLAPVAIVQPIGVLAVPFAIMGTALRTRSHPPPTLLVLVLASLAGVAGFVTLADLHLGADTRPQLVGVLTAAACAAALTAGLAAVGLRTRGQAWLRCAAFAASAATAFGLVSALMRLISLHLTTGANDLDDVGVLLPVVGIGLALAAGGWAVQQAHAAGAPAVVVGCMTVIDPLVAVTLGITMLGEGGSSAPGSVAGMLGCAALGLGAALLLARHHPDVARAAAAPDTVVTGRRKPSGQATTEDE